MLDGPLAALDAIEKATGESEVNVVGYCLGGTLLAATLAYMAAKGDERIKQRHILRHAGRLQRSRASSASSSTRSSCRARGAHGGAAAISRARDMATTFNMLRANDLIWSLRRQQLPAGQGPLPVRPALLELGFDAHAGGDAQLLSAQDVPGEPAGAAGRDHAGRRADRPAQGARRRASSSRPREDHIAPWRSTYAATQLYQGRCASCWRRPATSPAWSIRRPPRNTPTGPTPKHAARPATSGWRAPRSTPARGGRNGSAGSAKYAGGKVPARRPGDGKLKPIEDAPGSYVRVQAQ